MAGFTKPRHIHYLRAPFSNGPGKVPMKPIQMVDLIGQYQKIKPEVDAAMQQAGSYTHLRAPRPY